jgi:hypothetical protein
MLHGDLFFRHNDITAICKQMALADDSKFLPSGKAYTEVARYKVAESSTWAYPIVAGNRVFVKDRDALALWTIE